MQGKKEGGWGDSLIVTKNLYYDVPKIPYSY